MSTLLPLVVVAGLIFAYRIHARRQAARMMLSGGRRSLVMNLFGR